MKWDLIFSPSKCQVIQATTARFPIPTSYNLHGQSLGTLSSARYLGVYLSWNLSWNTHVERVASTTNRLNSKMHLSDPRSPTAQVCQQCLRSNIDKLEMVQRRAARILSDYSRYSSVTTMLETLGWSSFEQRRAESRLCLFYKIVHSLVAVLDARIRT